MSGTVAVFTLRGPWVIAGVVICLLLLFPVAGVRLDRLSGVRLFASTALMLGLLQVFFVREGRVLVNMAPLVITTEGLSRGGYIAGRFISVMLLSYLFVLTTEPSDLVYTLMRTGLPYRYGFALITALRLVPTFEEEGLIVYNAQLARGIRYDVRKPSRYLLLARQFVLPLLISALGKVDVLAVSMEGRCFGKYPTRTFLREVRITWLDGVSLGILLVCLVVLVWAKFLLIGG